MMSLLAESFPPKPTFMPERDIPNLSGKVIIVTGGNTGIGKETIKQLLLKNAKVYMASRTKSRAEAAIAELQEKTGRTALFLELDLGDLDAIRRAAEEFKSKEKALHILFNSAGVMTPPIDQLTNDGYDLQFGTNVLGHAHFTLLLIPELLAGAKSSADGKARVVNTSSNGAYLHPKILWDTLTDTTERKNLGSRYLYFQSKFGNAVFSNELARRYGKQGIISNALNPGSIRTELTRHSSAVVGWIADRMLYDVSFGALTQLFVGTSPETVHHNGAWFIPWARLGNSIGDEASDPETGKQLWEWIEEQRKGH